MSLNLADHPDLPIRIDGVWYLRCRRCGGQWPRSEAYFRRGFRVCYACEYVRRLSALDRQALGVSKLGRPRELARIVSDMAAEEALLLGVKPLPVALRLLGLPPDAADGLKGRWRERVKQVIRRDVPKL